MEQVKTFVDTKIKGKKVVIFSKSYCPFCTTAKRILKDHITASDYEEIELENREDCDAIQDYLKELTGARSVPRVFIDGKSIGGCDDCKALERSGKLKELLA